MEYKIGEVAKLLNISKEMIRYYEKHGALTPVRLSDNNYRTYSTMDVYLLMEIIRYQTMNFSVKEIKELLSHNYMQTYSDHLHEFHEQLNDEITHKQMLKERIKELSVRTNTSYLNLHNYWIKRIPDLDLIYMNSSNGDEYDRISISEKNNRVLFDNNNMAFFDAVVLFEENCETWHWSIRHSYAEALKLDMDATSLNEQLCLCTIVEMGDVGDFSRECLKPVYEYIEENHMKVNGTIRGVIIGRGYDYEKFRRIIEIQVPIKVLSTYRVMIREMAAHRK